MPSTILSDIVDKEPYQIWVGLYALFPFLEFKIYVKNL